MNFVSVERERNECNVMEECGLKEQAQAFFIGTLSSICEFGWLSELNDGIYS